MRSLLTVILLSLVGCNVWWQSFVGVTPTPDNGCAAGDSCDLGTPSGGDGGLGPLGDGGPLLTPCGASMTMCGGATPFCDANTGTCAASLPPNEPFPAGPPLETTVKLSQQYLLMATGDYNGDGVADVAVSGLFLGTANATGAKLASVEVYLGDGQGGLKRDANCDLGATDAPVYLLTVPGAGQQADLLVATFGARVLHCVRGAGSWTATALNLPITVPSGFKQLALINDEGSTYPDLAIRNSSGLYMDSGGRGSLSIYRNGGSSYSYSGTVVTVSNTGVTEVTPYRFGGGVGDSLALTWNQPTNHPGVEFQYVQTTGAVRVDGSGMTGSADTPGTGYSELYSNALASKVLFHVPGQAAPALLFTYSQSPNSVSVLYGSTVANFSVQAQAKMLTLGGVVLPFAGDANGDMQDEIGLYGTALNTTPQKRSLQLLSYKPGVINTGAPLVDISSTTENYRAMALEYLGGAGDARRLAKRKDLIVLVEDTVNSASRLLIRRANLNYSFP